MGVAIIIHMIFTNLISGHKDFNTSSHLITFSANSKEQVIPVDIELYDDDINEAPEGFFVLMEVVDETNSSVMISGENPIFCTIEDNDCKS